MLNEDKQALLDGTARIRCKLIVKATDTLPEIVLTEQNSVKDWVYNDERYVPQQGFIGQFVARTLEGNLQNISDDFNIENRELELQLGIVRNTTETWYSMGNFIVTDPEDNEVKDNTKFQAMDYTKLFNKRFDGDYTDSVYTASYNKLIETGSVTALWLAKYACAQVGVDFPQTSFTNSAFTINQNPFQAGESCRDVLKEISKLAYSWVRIGQDNKCYIDFNQVNDSSVDIHNVINKDTYYTLETKKTIYGPINNVVVGMAGVDGESHSIKDQASINQYGEHTIYIYDNPLTNTFELRELAQQQANKLFGLNYVHLEVETVGHPWLQGNERINVLDMEDENNFTYPFNKSLKYAGHIRSVINTMGESEVESTLAYESGFVKNIRNASLNVDKQNGKITALVEDMTTNNGIINERISSLQIDINGTTSRVSNVEKQVEDIGDEMDNIYDEIDGVQINLDDFIDNDYVQGISNLQKQIDGAIQFWNGPEIPTLNNYPTNQWTTENDKINHQADIYTVIEDIDGELKQGKSYRFDKVDGKWVWIELTDNELSAVQALAQEALDKAKQNEGDVVTLKSDVSDLKQTDKEITASVDSIENTLVPTADVSGSNIVVNDSTDASLVKFNIEGKSEQKVTTQGVNLCPPFTDSRWSFSGGAYVDTNGNLQMPNANSAASVDILWKKRSNAVAINVQLVTGGNLILGTQYLDSNKNLLSGNGSAAVDKADGFIHTTTFGGSNQYGDALGQSQYFRLMFHRDSTYATQPYSLKNPMVSVHTASYTPFVPDSPSPEYPSEIESVGYENLLNAPSELNVTTFINIDTDIKSGTYKITLDSINTNSVSSAILLQFYKGDSYVTAKYFYMNSTEDTITLTSDVDVVRIYSGSSYNDSLDKTTTITNLMITKDTEQHSYIPYGKYGIEVETVGKNLFNAKLIPASTGIVVNEDGSQIVMPRITTGNGAIYTGTKLSVLAPKLKVGDIVYMHFERNPNVNINGMIYLNGANILWYRDTFKTITQEMLDSEVCIYGNRYSDGETEQVTLLNFRMSYERTTFVPYQKNISVIVLNEPLRSLPSGVKDIAYIKNNKLYVDRYVGSIVLDGSEEWTSYTNGAGLLAFRTRNTNITGNKMMMSNYFKGIVYGDTALNGQFGNTSQWHNLNFCYIDCSTVDNFKIWLSTHNTEVIYELATPVTEDYGEVDYPITYKNITNIATTDDLEPNMNITYVREGSMTDYIAGQFTEKDIIQSRKFSELSIKADGISASVTSVEGDLAETSGKVNSLETKMTSQEATIKIVETHINKDDGTMAANEVTTSNGFTFNSDGLNIYVGENSYNTQINNIGTFYRDGDEIIGQTSKDGSILKNLKMQGQTQYSFDGDSYDFIEERVEVDGEYCYATFYNGEE